MTSGWVRLTQGDLDQHVAEWSARMKAADAAGMTEDEIRIDQAGAAMIEKYSYEELEQLFLLYQGNNNAFMVERDELRAEIRRLRGEIRRLRAELRSLRVVKRSPSQPVF